MQTATDELRELVDRRAIVFLECVACALSAAALWTLSGRLQSATPELQTIFLALVAVFAPAFLGSLAKLIPVLAFRCPRCDGLFHVGVASASLRLRACAHCGFSVGSAGGDAADEGRFRAPRL